MTLDAARHWIAFHGGSLLLRRAQWRPAANLLGRATQLAPDHWESHHQLAIALLKLGQWEDAAGMAQRAIKLNPTAADSHDCFGIALLQLERWDEAVVAYRRATALDPARYDSYDRLGLALWRLERWDEVVEAYQAALKLGAGGHPVHHRLGVALLRLGRWDEAASALRRAIELAGQDAAAAAELAGLKAQLAMAEAQVEASKRAGKTAVALHPRTKAHLQRAMEQLMLQHWDVAVEELAKGSALTPGLGGLHFLQVDPLARLGRFREAVAAHQRSLAAGGDLPGLPGQSATARFAQRQAAFWTERNLGGDVFEAERWLARSSAITEQAAPGPRLLFVLDNDFGELTTVMCLLLGQPMAARTTLLLPERLYAQNLDVVPGRTHRYASVEDILGVVNREQPDIVLLCSGYLLGPHLGFSAASLGQLVGQLRERGCVVVTADPFLGRLSQQDPRSLFSFSVPRTLARELAAVADRPGAAEQLMKVQRDIEEQACVMLGQSEQVLRDSYHLYPSYCDVAEDDVAETDARNIAFFNDRLLRPAPAEAPGAAAPHWLFILATTDWDVQAVAEGETAFADIVASKLVETLGAGRHPILIAPQAFIDQLLPRMPTAEGIDILAHCPFAQFMSLLLCAEQAFYWNVVSHSILVRLYNQLPVVVFDRGHLVRSAPAIHDRIVRWYYQGWQAPLRDHREPLTPETVEGWAAGYRREAARLVERFRRAPDPEAMIGGLMRTESKR